MTSIAQNDYNDKSIDGVLRTQTQGGRMVGADESTKTALIICPFLPISLIYLHSIFKVIFF